MINNTKIIAFTPGGRKSSMQILEEYMQREHNRGHVDQWIIFNNAYTLSDEEYIKSLVKYDWVKLLEFDVPMEERSGEMILRFYEQLTESNCFYLRVDDDIVYMGEDTIEKLVNFKLANPEYFLVFPVIINNTRMNYYLQQNGNIKSTPVIPNKFLELEYSLFDIKLPTYLHEKALSAIKKGTIIDEFTIPNRSLSYKVVDTNDNNGQFDPEGNKCTNYLEFPECYLSVSCFVVDGKDLLKMSWRNKDGVFYNDEETHLAGRYPQELKRNNGVCGNSVVAHFSYAPMAGLLYKTDLLQRYGKIIGLSLPAAFEHPVANGANLKILRDKIVK